MNVMIIGGTGFLGYYAALEFLRRGHTVKTVSLPDVPLGEWFPPQIEVRYGDVFTMPADELTALFHGCDAMIYAVGPDDRVTPPAPAYEFFHERLVEACVRVVAAARKGGVRRCVVLNSYFATFHRLHPHWNLTDHHPYIRCRVEQAERVIAEGKNRMAVMVLELPYIFGTMPERVPLWRDVLFERLRREKTILYPRGGSNMIAAEHVAEAIVGAAEQGRHGRCYPIGDVNMSWNEMLAIMLDAMDMHKKIVNVPVFLAKLGGQQMKKEHEARGLESGLDPVLLMKDIMGRCLYFDPTESQRDLGYGSGGIEDSIRKTVKACYPEEA